MYTTFDCLKLEKYDPTVNTFTCIPSPPPNLNCADISDKGFQVSSPDPHGFDRDEDGIDCES